MVAKHSVKVNGVWYRAGEEIAPAKTETQEKNFLDEFEEEIKAKESMYTKTEINRMSTAELKEVAKLNGVKDADDMTGGELKKVLIDKFEL
jgi:hypothetical protein